MTFSPMFKHAIESFEHSLEHFLDGTERSRKFALLHIDQSIELFIKEKCIRLGKSIYKADGTTLTFHEAFKSLDKEISIPEKPRLEELHDLRNTIQHKGLLPDHNTTKYYVEIGYYFVKRFLNEALSTNIEDILSIQHRSLIEGPMEIETPTEIIQLLQEAQLALTPESKIISGYTVLERAVKIINKSDNIKSRFRKTIIDTVTQQGASKDIIEKELITIFRIRGNALHTQHEATDEDSIQFLKAVENILKLMGYEIPKSS